MAEHSIVDVVGAAVAATGLVVAIAAYRVSAAAKEIASRGDVRDQIAGDRCNLAAAMVVSEVAARTGGLLQSVLVGLNELPAGANAPRKLAMWLLTIDSSAFSGVVELAPHLPPNSVADIAFVHAELGDLRLLVVRDGAEPAIRAQDLLGFRQKAESVVLRLRGLMTRHWNIGHQGGVPDIDVWARIQNGHAG